MATLDLDPKANPIVLFESWFNEARASDQPMPEAMNLATVAPDGTPASRMVLLKGVTPEGFIFYTNYQSDKAQHIQAHPHAALCFWWLALHRQVRIRGGLEKTSPDLSDAYFQTRPRDSQLGAWASPQSQSIADRDELLARYHRFKDQFADQDVPRPPHWGGYLLRPHTIEFWSEGEFRLHDRLVYTLDAQNQWTRTHLAP